MANEAHVARLEEGVASWNVWRAENRDEIPDLSGAALHGANLHGATLSKADLTGAKLHGAILIDAHLRYAHLTGAILHGANLIDADLTGAILHGASLSKADLSYAILNYAALNGADLNGANLSETYFDETYFTDVDLSKVIGLETCRHQGPSSIDHRTLEKSPNLPLAFLRGIGLPDRLIDYLPSLLNQPIQFYSCLINYSTKDEDLAERLHADLQNKGVRCWFAPRDLPIGAKILDGIDEAIRLRDKMLLILSERSISSDWVENEVQAGLEEERKRGEIVLFPIRLDDAIFNTKEAWAAKLRARNIG